LLVLVFVTINTRSAAVSAATTITYTRDAAKLANLWVDQYRFEVILGGSKAPKLTGSDVSAGIITWDEYDTHHMRKNTVPYTAVLSTGDVRWAISQVKYNGGDKVPTYPNIVNSNISVSGTAGQAPHQHPFK
jgi:hypothetical protein